MKAPYRSQSWIVVGIVVIGFVNTTRAAAKAAPAKGIDASLFSPMKWRSIGPTRGGRSVAVTGVPSQPLVFYMGGTGGGVWKTEDGGSSWSPIADKFLKTGSVGAIAVADGNPNIVYVGMGESCVRGNFSHGDGVYKSHDAGKTWEHIGLEDSRQIGRVRIRPDDPNIVYVAALGHIFGPSSQRGVFRSTDGGKRWERVLFVDELTGAVDLAMDATNPQVIYAAMWQVRRTPYALESGGPGSGIYKTTDGGDTWVELTKGLPEGIKGRIGVAVSPVNPNRVWAIVEADKGGIFRSEDGGESWQRINEDRGWRQRAWYYTHIYADTQNANTVYVLNTRFGKSTDGGKTFSSIRVPHGDNHDLWIAPDDNQRMVNANDGGANISFNGGKSWSRQDMQPTAQFYHVITDNRFPYRVYGAQQDNSTVSISSRARPGPRAEFYSVGGGESGYIAPHPDDPNIVFAGSYGGFMTRYDRTARQFRNISIWPENPMGWGAGPLKYRFQWTFPILFSPHDANVIYAAGNVLFKTTNEGQSWEAISPDLTTNDKSKQGPSGGPITHDNTSVEYYCTIFSVAESPHEKGVIWAGSDDGLVHITRDGGGAWDDVTPLDLPKWATVSMIEISPHDPATCYLAVNAYKMDDFSPYIFKTGDYGKTWSLLTEGIPRDAFVRVVREDPNRKGLLYAGTETGAYVSFDDGGHWQSLQLNLPIVPITDMVVKENDLVAATQGRAFWILDDLTLLHQLGEDVTASNMHLFAPRRSVSGVDRTITVRYHLKNKPEEKLTLDFLDGEGDVIKSFTTKDPEAKDEPEPQHSFFFFASGSKNATADQGMNEFEWNMRYEDATELKDAIMWGGSTHGPVAPPGSYEVRLTVGDTAVTQPLKIVIDPRTASSREDFDKRFALELKIRDALSQAHDAIIRIRSIRKQAKAAGKHIKDYNENEEVAEAAKELGKKLTAIEEKLIQTKSKSGQDPLNFPIQLNNKIAGLAGVISRANYAPTNQSLAVFDDLDTQLQEQLAALKSIVDTHVAAFNTLVRKQDVPAIVLKKPK